MFSFGSMSFLGVILDGWLIKRRTMDSWRQLQNLTTSPNFYCNMPNLGVEYPRDNSRILAHVRYFVIDITSYSFATHISLKKNGKRTYTYDILDFLFIQYIIQNTGLFYSLEIYVFLSCEDFFKTFLLKNTFWKFKYPN